MLHIELLILQFLKMLMRNSFMSVIFWSFHFTLEVFHIEDCEAPC